MKSYKQVNYFQNYIKNSLNFWQQRLNNSSQTQTNILLKNKQRTIVDRVVIRSTKYWKQIADEFSAQSSTNKSVQSLSSQSHNQQIYDC
ncbi:unnamed protein product [Paramecium pentaurelia]|uniref:Uncharacterized protein n=1 Tax=Paramecium pentaurelia TaxID=43138 RepID=A0A8S1YP15_9CILI|nr:unnamed protein product [Paramecium pentaurelia]